MSSQRIMYCFFNTNQEVLEKFKTTGTGWQTRMNEVLRQWASRH